MRKVVIIVIVLIVAGFFTFFEVNIESGNKSLNFIESFKSEIGYISYEAEYVFSTNENVKSFRITFNGCNIDTSNIKHYNELGEKLAKEINLQINESGNFKNIILIFI